MARIGAGVAVLVVGPTVTGGRQAIGHTGTVDRWVIQDQVLPEWQGDQAARSGWVVVLARPATWGIRGIFPAASLMPLDSESADESESTDQPIAEVA